MLAGWLVPPFKASAKCFFAGWVIKCGCSMKFSKQVRATLFLRFLCPGGADRSLLDCTLTTLKLSTAQAWVRAQEPQAVSRRFQQLPARKPKPAHTAPGGYHEMLGSSTRPFQPMYVEPITTMASLRKSFRL